MSTLSIHPKAVIDPSAKLGTGVVVDAYAVVEKDTEIGDHTQIAPHAVIHAGARIGEHCKIGVGACISGAPQDLKFKDEHTLAYIGDHTTVREYVTVNRGTRATAETRIGRHCLLMAYAHVAHDCKVGDHCILSNSVNVAGHAEIGDWVTMGGVIGVHQFTRIGDHAMVAMSSGVRKDVPPYVSAGKEPLRFCGINLVGMQRRGITAEVTSQIKQIYGILYKKGLNRSQALKDIAEMFPASEARDNILKFVKNSERGIIGS